MSTGGSAYKSSLSKNTASLCIIFNFTSDWYQPPQALQWLMEKTSVEHMGLHRLLLNISSIAERRELLQALLPYISTKLVQVLFLGCSPLQGSYSAVEWMRMAKKDRATDWSMQSGNVGVVRRISKDNDPPGEGG